ELDLDAYSPAPEADVEARSRADGVLNPPEASDHLVVQIDGTTFEGASADVEGDGRPHEPLVASLDASLERFPHLREMLGELAPGDDPFVARNDPAWTGGALVYVPRGKRLEAPALITAVQDAEASALAFRTLIVIEEGA